MTNTFRQLRAVGRGRSGGAVARFEFFFSFGSLAHFSIVVIILWVSFPIPSTDRTDLGRAGQWRHVFFCVYQLHLHR